MFVHVWACVCVRMCVNECVSDIPDVMLQSDSSDEHAVSSQRDRLGNSLLRLTPQGLITLSN